MTTRVHYMPADPPPSRRAVFRYDLPSVSTTCVIRRRRVNLPLPAWVCPRPVEYDGPVRAVKLMCIMDPLKVQDEVD